MRVVSARSYFARMNENRNDTNWLTDEQLLRGTEEFFKLNDYFDIEYNQILDQGGRTFSSPIVASRTKKYDDEEDIDETIISIFKSKIKQYDLSFLGYLESFAFNILDNYELTNPMLVTDALSYFHIIKNEEISVAVENIMRDGLFILFLNHRFAYALFDKFENMTKPIPIYD
jgi:parvulin-like peptidyl-prolyl isomerase